MLGFSQARMHYCCHAIMLRFKRFPVPPNTRCSVGSKRDFWFCFRSFCKLTMPKAVKKKKEKHADFTVSHGIPGSFSVNASQKAKLKLGKGKKVPTNSTNTSFKARCTLFLLVISIQLIVGCQQLPFQDKALSVELSLLSLPSRQPHRDSYLMKSWHDFAIRMPVSKGKV